MGAVSITHRGGFKNLERFLKGFDKQKLIAVLDSYGQRGVQALRAATPVDTGLTADSWGYRTSISRSSFSIEWTNSHMTSQGTPVAILLQYGHGTRQGGYVQGQDYINPAIEPIFNELANAVWREVSNI